MWLSGRVHGATPAGVHPRREADRRYGLLPRELRRHERWPTSAGRPARPTRSYRPSSTRSTSSATRAKRRSNQSTKTSRSPSTKRRLASCASSRSLRSSTTANRATSPPAQKIVAAVDVQKESLWWAVVAWGEGMTGWVLDYGCYPEQKRSFFSNARPPKPLCSSVYPGLNEDQAIFQGLTDLVEKLAGRVYKLSDGSEHLLDRLVIDEGYKPATVHLFCRQSKTRDHAREGFRHQGWSPAHARMADQERRTLRH